MNLPEAIQILEQHNLVLHGKMISKPKGKDVREAIEIAVNILKTL